MEVTIKAEHSSLLWQSVNYAVKKFYKFDFRLHEKDEEFENVRKNLQRMIESLQVPIS